MKDADLIWQIAVVRLDEAGRQWLEFNDSGRCGRCSSGTGCGAALFSRLFVRPDARVPMPAGEKRPADRLVRVGLDPGWLMLAAAATYLLPVIAFVGGALLADRLLPGDDPAALVSAVSFALAAVVLARYPLRLIGAPRLQIVDLHEATASAGLESAEDSGHFSGRAR